jgi:hypothetical protein
MNSDTIIEIAIDDSGRLTIKPKTQKFAHIYRAATEVHWDSINERLYSPKPREWSHLDWYKHMISGVESEYGCKLVLAEDTQWINVPNKLKNEIEAWEKTIRQN